MSFLRNAYRERVCYIRKSTAHRGKYDKGSESIFVPLKSIQNDSLKRFALQRLRPSPIVNKRYTDM